MKEKNIFKFNKSLGDQILFRKNIPNDRIEKGSVKMCEAFYIVSIEGYECRKIKGFSQGATKINPLVLLGFRYDLVLPKFP
ncbi:hypothetical protein [Liberibacter crescens]|nr:hypothetical protein [Liberibacter crescens]